MLVLFLSMGNIKINQIELRSDDPSLTSLKAQESQECIHLDITNEPSGKYNWDVFFLESGVASKVYKA